MKKVCLNLGSGNDYITSNDDFEWTNVDISQNVKADVYADLFEIPYPFKNDTFDYIKAFDFLEHIPHTLFDENGKRFKKDGFLVVMSELHRILKPGGVLEARFPTPGHVYGTIDPTHTRSIHRETFEWYLVKDGPYAFYSEQHWILEGYKSDYAGNSMARVRKPE